MSDSKVFERIVERTKSLVHDNERLNGLLVGVGEKLTKVGDGSEESKSFVKLLKMLVRMVNAHLNGTYRSFSPMTLLYLAFALVYFVTPIDLIPDFFPILGFTDDLAVTVSIGQRISEDIASFKEWEQSELSQ